MKPFLLFLISVLVLGSAAATSAQTVRTVAIADFVDESHDGVLIGATKLNTVLERILTARAGGRLRVVSSDQVRAAMQAQGVTARDLVSPTRAIAVAQAVGAEWIVTGRWTALSAEPFSLPSPSDPNTEIVRYIEGAGLFDFRVLEAATRRTVLQEAVGSESRGFFRFGVLWQAAELALLRAADRILRL